MGFGKLSEVIMQQNNLIRQVIPTVYVKPSLSFKSNPTAQEQKTPLKAVVIANAIDTGVALLIVMAVISILHSVVGG